ncbi:ribose-phosphate diphosphokinase [Candidatus Rickettsia tasmanensis]
MQQEKAGANRIILVMPYFGYARQDNINSQNIIPAKLIADFLEKLGVNHVITIDLHSDKIEKFFNIPISNLEPINLYIPFLRTYSNFVIVAPDKGSINRVQKISNLLNIDSAYINKERDINNNCEMISITGSVEGKNCILIDDIIDSGETIVKAARFLKEHSALSVSAFITHAVLSAGSKNSIINLLENEANKEEFVGNTERSIAAYTLVREDASTGLTYKLPLEASYARGLLDNIFITDTIETSDLSTKFHIIPVLSIIVKELINIL